MMGVTAARSWISDHLGLILLSILLTLFSPIFTDLLPNASVSLWAKILLIVGNVLLAIYTAASELRRIELGRKLLTDRSTWEAEQRETQYATARRTALLASASARVGETISLLRDLTAQNVGNSSDRGDAGQTRQAAVKGVLSALCRVLDADRPMDSDPLKVVYFKATFFKYESAGGVLKREYWHYPDTLQPHTAEFRIDKDSNAGIVVAFTGRREVVMPSVAEAAAAGLEWKDKRPAQHVDYANSSMICIPIWADSRESLNTSSPVMGVLTIDTNQINYFRVGEDARAERNEVLGPFLSLLRLAYAVVPDDPTEV